jgi:hypothetical protein
VAAAEASEAEAEVAVDEADEEEEERTVEGEGGVRDQPKGTRERRSSTSKWSGSR